MFLSLIVLAICQVGAQSLDTTSLTACVNDSISLPGNDPSRLVKQSWWKARYQDSPWIEIGHCVKTRGCITSKTVLPDFTKVWIRSNGSLIVERSADQRNSTQFQFLVEDNLKRRHIFKVNFTVYCIWTELSGNLNISQVVLGLYPTKNLVELYLFDANGTKFAAIHSDNGASLLMTNESHPMTAYWKRLRIERGALIFLEINEVDNGTTIIVQARLNPEQTSTRLGSLSTKTIQIFVFYSAEPTVSPQASTSFPKDIDDPPSLSSTPKFNGQTTKTSSGPAWYEQAWGIALFLMVAIIVIIIFILIILLIKMKCRSGGSPSPIVPQQISMSPSISTQLSYPQVNKTESVRRR